MSDEESQTPVFETSGMDQTGGVVNTSENENQQKEHDSGVTVIYSRERTSPDQFEYRQQSELDFPENVSEMYHQAAEYQFSPGHPMFDQLQQAAARANINVTTSTFSEQDQLQFKLNQQDRSGQTLFLLENCQLQSTGPAVAVNEAFVNLKKTTKGLLNHDDPMRHVSTFAERSAFKLLNSLESIIISGRSGTGKTRVARKLLKDIAKETGRIPLEITTSSQWDLIPPTKLRGEKYVVMIDDIFGSSTFVQAKFDDWQIVMPSMWSLAEKGDIKFIITSRSEIMAECKQRCKKFKLISSAKSVALDEKEYMLRKCEKRKFLKKYCPNFSFSDAEVQKIVEIQTSLGFPQCCCFFAESKQAQQRGIHYFLKPLEFLGEVILDLKHQDPLGHLVLLLVVMKKGFLQTKDLNPFKMTEEFKKLIENTAQACLLDTVPSVAKIKMKALELCGTYLIESKTEFQFQHQSVYDAMILNISQEYPDFCVEISPANILLDLVRTQAHKNKDHEAIISLTDDCYKSLATRVTEILLSEENTDILDHQCLRDQEFLDTLLKQWDAATVAKILKYPISQSTLETHVMDVNEDDTWLSMLRNFGWIPIKRICLFRYDHIVSYFILKEINVLTDFILESYYDHLMPKDLSQILTCCVYKNRKKLIDMLMTRNAKPRPDTIRSLCAVGYFDQRQRDVIMDSFEEGIESLGELEPLLSVALFSGNFAMFAHLVEEMKRPTNPAHQKSFRLCLMQLAVQGSDAMKSVFDANFEPKKDFDVVAATEILMNTNCRIDIGLLVNMASGQDDPVLLRYLLQRPVDIKKMYSGKSPLHVAILFGSCECVVELVNKGADVTAVTNYTDAEVYNDNLGFSVSRSSVLHFVAMSTKDKCRKLAFLLEVLLTCTNRKAWKHRLLETEDLRDEMTEDEIDDEIEGAGLDLSDEDIDEAVDEYLNLTADEDQPTSNPRLIVNDVDVDVKDIKERTPLQIAAKFRCKSYLSSSVQNQQAEENCAFVEELIKKGADLNLKDGDDYTALHYATANGNIDIVKVLIKAGAKTDITDGDGSSLYHFVAGRRTYYKEDDISLQAKKTLCDIFIQAGCEIDAADLKGRTCLHEAAKHGDILMLRYLQKKGTNINAQDKEGKTVLHDAAREGDMDMITFLCDKGSELGIKDNDGQTVLHEAAKSAEDAVEKLQYLLRRKPDVLKTVDDMDRTAIFPAVESGDTEVVEFLVEKGLSLSAKDKKGNTLLHRACKYKLIDMVNYLLKRQAKVDELSLSGKASVHFAVKMFQVEPKILKMLLDAGADPNRKCSAGNAPLHILIYQKYNNYETRAIPCLKLLLEASANPNIQDAALMTPLHFAAEAKNSQGVQLLLEHGADPNIRDEDGNTALLVAMQKKYNEDCVTLLINKALISFQQDKDGCTLLHHLAASGNAKAIKSLLQRGADPHITNKKEQTALNVAKDGEALEVLLSHGVDPDHSDKEGMTALHSFAKSRDVKSVALLLEKRANPSLQDKEGNTPIHLICQDFKKAFFTIFRHTSAVEMVTLFKRFGCEVNLRNHSHHTAFDIIKSLPSHNDAQMESSRETLLKLLKE